MAPLTKVAVTRWENVRGEQIEAYWRRLREVGLEPIDFSGPGSSLEGCVGLVLTGGVDVAPARYGEKRGPRTQALNRERDEFEAQQLALALARDLPVLAICRGHQLLNVCLGGSLLQHVGSGEHVAYADEAGTSRSHDVAIVRDSRLHGWLGSDSLVVNSRHHQAITPERLAPELRIAALSTDGLVEAAESESHAWVVGVQWHPEREEPEIEGFAQAGRHLFAAFAVACNRTIRSAR